MKPPLSSSPPPVRRSLQRPILRIVGATMLALVVLLIAAMLDQDPVPADAEAGDDVLGNVAPKPLTRDDLRSINRGQGTDVKVARAGWIETVDPKTGLLAQRYRFISLDPAPQDHPEGTLRLHEPEAEIYLRTGELITLSGDEALARAPNQTLEDGTLFGNVIVRLFDAAPGHAIDPQTMTPALVVRTEEARFNSVVGEITCSDDVLIETPQAEIPGRGMRMRVNDHDEQVALHIEHVEYIRLSMAVTAPEDESPAAPTDATPATAEPSPPKSPKSPKSRPVEVAASPAEPIAEPAADDLTAEGEAIDFYLLTLHDNVVIRQGPRGARRTATGDRLEVVFSSVSAGVGTPAVARSGSSRHSGSRVARLASNPSANGALRRDEPDEHVTIITCDGGLTMVPLGDESRRPEDPSDAHLQLLGDPVYLEDAAAEATSFAARLEYRAATRTVELIGSDTHPLRMRTPRVEIDGERFLLSQNTGAGGFIGAGHLRADRSETAGMAVPIVASSYVDGRQLAVAAAPTDDPVRIDWRDGLDLQFDQGDAMRLRSARFAGAVRVESREMNMDADTIEATFGNDASEGGQPPIEAIAAEGAQVRRADGNGHMSAETLELELEPDGDGTSLRRLAARGSVEADDGGQVMWVDQLDATFAQTPDPENATGLVTSMDTVDAAGNLQIMLDGGARLFADALEADGSAGTARITGDEVMIAADDLVIVDGRRIDLDQNARTAHWRGPGVALVLPVPLDTRVPGPMARPVLAEHIETRVNAAWTEAMIYAFGDDETSAGTVDLYGSVEAKQTTVTDESTLTGERVTLTFTDENDEAGDSDATAPTSSRRLRELIARGNAKLEGRRENNADDLEQLFYIKGEHVAFDHLRTEASVIGAGQLLIVDRTIEDADASSAPFSGKGITNFDFTDGLDMRHIVDDRYRITMSGDVNGQHKGLDEQWATVAGQRFEATAVRLADGDDAPADGDPAPGMRMRLLDLHGTGDILMRTPKREVQCDRLDYNVSSGIAHLEAEPGRTVTIMATDATPVKARSIRWNMNDDTVRLDGASGSAH